MDGFESNLYAPSATSGGSAFYVSTPSQTPGATQPVTDSPDQRDQMMRKYMMMKQMFGGASNLFGPQGAYGSNASQTSIPGGVSSGLQSGMNQGLNFAMLKKLAASGGFGGG